MWCPAPSVQRPASRDRSVIKLQLAPNVNVTCRDAIVCNAVGCGHRADNWINGEFEVSNSQVYQIGAIGNWEWYHGFASKFEHIPLYHEVAFKFEHIPLYTGIFALACEAYRSYVCIYFTCMARPAVLSAGGRCA